MPNPKPDLKKPEWDRVRLITGSGRMNEQETIALKKHTLDVACHTQFGGHMSLIAAQVGVTRHVIGGWLKRDDDFREAWEAIQQQLKDLARARLYYEGATNGNERMLTKYLEAEYPNEYGRRQVELSVGAGDADSMLKPGESVEVCMLRYVRRSAVEIKENEAEQSEGSNDDRKTEQAPSNPQPSERGDRAGE